MFQAINENDNTKQNIKFFCLFIRTATVANSSDLSIMHKIFQNEKNSKITIVGIKLSCMVFLTRIHITCNLFDASDQENNKSLDCYCKKRFLCHFEILIFFKSYQLF